MRAADPVQNLGTAEVVHLDRIAGSPKPAPVYAQRGNTGDEDASGTFAFEIDVRSASSQLYQWLVIFAVAGLAIGGAKWWSARQGEAIAELVATPSVLATMQQATGGASRSTPDDGTVSAVDPGAAGTHDAIANTAGDVGGGDPATAAVATSTTEGAESSDGSTPDAGDAPTVAGDELAVAADDPAPPMDTADVRTVRAPADVPYPRRVEGVDPDVPEGAAVQRGIAVLSVLIDARGNVVEAELLRNVDPTLDDAALTAVRQWKFEPTVHDGRPVAVRSNFTVRFGY